MASAACECAHRAPGLTPVLPAPALLRRRNSRPFVKNENLKVVKLLFDKRKLWIQIDNLLIWQTNWRSDLIDRRLRFWDWDHLKHHILNNLAWKFQNWKQNNHELTKRNFKCCTPILQNMHRDKPLWRKWHSSICRRIEQHINLVSWICFWSDRNDER